MQNLQIQRKTLLRVVKGLLKPQLQASLDGDMMERLGFIHGDSHDNELLMATAEVPAHLEVGGSPSQQPRRSSSTLGSRGPDARIGEFFCRLLY